MLENPLRSYLNQTDENAFQFSKRSGIPCSTIYRIVKEGANPYRKTAKKICKYSFDKLTLKDFGYDE